MTDHYAETNRLTDGLRGLQGHNADFDMALAQVHATLELAEQQRIANLIALAGTDNPLLAAQVADDSVDTLSHWNDHENTDLGGWRELRPEIARALRIETP